MKRDPILSPLLYLSLWIARIHILAAIALILHIGYAVPATNNFQYAASVALGLRFPVIALVQYLTVQTILASRLRGQLRPNWVRYTFAAIDSGCLFSIAIACIHTYRQQNLPKPYLDKGFSLAFLYTLLVQGVALILLVLLRIAIIYHTRGGCLFAPFYEDSRGSTFRRFGEGLNGLVGENPVLIFIRVLMVVIVSFALLSYGIYSIILEPSEETTLTPIKTIRTSDNSGGPQGRWTLFVKPNSEQPDDGILSNSVNVTTLVETGFSECSKSATRTNITIDCIFSPAVQETIVTVNFTSLINSSAAYVLFGDSLDIEELRANALPLVLNPTAHLHGHFVMEGRNTLAEPSSAFWGIFVPVKPFYIAKIFSLLTDPSPPIVQTNANLTGVATLRLTSLDEDIAPRMTVITDYREKTVMRGLSSAGGLVTVCSGIFAFLFGGSLLYQLVGMKSLGPFGLLHAFQTRRLREANSIPTPSSPLEKFLHNFFVDFGSGGSRNALDQGGNMDNHEGEGSKGLIPMENKLVMAEEGVRTRFRL